MTVLVTGGTGFTGAEVLRMLAERGDNDLHAFDVNPSAQRLDDLGDRVDVVRGDVGNLSQVINVVQKVKPDVIYHLGGMLSAPSELEPAAAFQANAAGTFHVLEAARMFSVPKVVFSSTVGTYGLDIGDDPIDDTTLQRPQLFYGATKVFGELAGRFYARKYGIDFRGVRFPAVIGPGVRTPGVAQFASWVIERCARGEPFTLWVEPRTRVPSLYYKDAARSLVELADAPLDNVPTAIYLIAGVQPAPSAGEIVEAVRARLPDAQIAFEPDPEVQAILDNTLKPLDDSCAREEWGWEIRYELDPMVDDFLLELEANPGRYG